LLKLETLRTAHELDRVKARWLSLQNECDCTLFQSYELNRRVADWFAARETPNVIVAESDSGMAIIPAVRRERELGLIGETLFDYRDVLGAGDPGVLDAAWRELALAGLPLEVTALRGLETRARWQVLSPTEFCNAPTTRHCDITAEQFVAAHKKSAKASRRFAREGFQLIRRTKDLRHVAEWLYRQKAGWGGSDNLFCDIHRRNLMLYIINRSVCNRTIWSYETRGGDIAGALVTFEHGRRRHFYTIHHDPMWDRFSPGQVMIFDVTRESLAEGLDVDFMTGEYPYKNRLATAMVPLFRVKASAQQMSLWGRVSANELRPAA
jgi:CelD/BcsL family acetyltransferase involved in cellulose biosynthesis